MMLSQSQGGGGEGRNKDYGLDLTVRVGSLIPNVGRDIEQVT